MIQNVRPEWDKENALLMNDSTTGPPFQYIWKILNYLGYESSNNYTKLRLYLVAIFTIYMLTQTLLAIVFRWDDRQTRYKALEDISFCYYCSLLVLDLLISPKHLFTLISVAQENYFTYKTKLQTILNKCINDSNKFIKKQLNNFLLSLVFFAINKIVEPLILIMFIYYNGKLDEDKNKILPLPFQCWFPFPVNRIFVYLIIYSYNVYYTFIIACFSFLTLGSTMSSMHHLASEIRLLSLSIYNIDEIISNDVYWHNNNVLKEFIDSCEKFGNSNTTDLNKIRELRLRFYTKELIQHHINIIRLCKRTNEGVSISSMSTNQTVCIVLCFNLYWFVEAKDVFDRVKFAFTLVLAILLFFFYTINGQTVLDEDENLRKTLIECPWVDKPDWFKRCYLIMLIQTIKPLQIKPFGLYVKSYSSFTKVMNGAYSYFNVLRTLR